MRFVRSGRVLWQRVAFAAASVCSGVHPVRPRWQKAVAALVRTSPTRLMPNSFASLVMVTDFALRLLLFDMIISVVSFVSVGGVGSVLRVGWRLVVGGSIDGSVDPVVGGRLVGWSVGRLVGWWVGWSVGWSAWWWWRRWW